MLHIKWMGDICIVHWWPGLLSPRFCQYMYTVAYGYNGWAGGTWFLHGYYYTACIICILADRLSDH